MFKPKTERLRQLAELFPERITELERLLVGRVHVYIDYANVLHWSKKLGWHIDLKRLHQFLSSFSQVREISLYHGTLVGEAKSEQFIELAKRCAYRVVTKSVKIMYLPIDVRNTPNNSKSVLNGLIKTQLLHQLKPVAIKYLNEQLRDLNQNGVTSIKLMKCNFDVELSRDMLLDFAQDKADAFVLWSGDSDFVEPVRQLLADGKQVVIFAAPKRISLELGRLGAEIFDINKSRNFICYAKEMKVTCKN